MPVPAPWVLLSYRLPRDPSTPRITLWRSLRKLGAVQVVDGLVALPDIERTREQLEWLADGVVAAGGTAVVWSAAINHRSDHEALVAEARAARNAEYEAIESDACSAAQLNDPTTRARDARRLRTELQRVVRRDYFAAAGRAEADAAVSRLHSTVETAS